MRNPKDSWHLSDSYFGYCPAYDLDKKLDMVCERWVEHWAKKENIDLSNPQEREVLFSRGLDFLFANGVTTIDSKNNILEINAIGPKDMKLAQTLIAAGPEHRKFMRQIFVSMDITMSLAQFKEFDTYKVGTVANSTSTMHTLENHPITLDKFEIDDYNPYLQVYDPPEYDLGVKEQVEYLIAFLETLRQRFIETGDKRYWKELIRWLPEGWLQKRTVTMSYENLYVMVRQRYNHKMNEWSGKDNPTLPNFVEEIRKLPYAQQFIFYGLEDK